MARNYGSTGPYTDNPFEDPAKYEEILNRITTNVQQINRTVANLESLKQQIGTPNDSKSKRDDIHEREQKTNRMVQITKDLLIQLSNYTVRDKRLKVQADRTKNDFHNVVTRYAQVQRDIVERLSATRQPSVGQLVDVEGEDQPFGAPQAQAQTTADLALDMEREDRMRQLESDVINVQGIFEELSRVVYEQRDAVDSIENNVDNAYHQVEDGNEQLARAVSHRNAARKRCIIIIIVVLIALGLVALIIWLSVRK